MRYNRPPGLERRRMFRIDRGRVVVEEHWDITVPGCSIVENPFVGGLATLGGKYVRQVEMTNEEFAKANVDLFGA